MHEAADARSGFLGICEELRIQQCVTIECEIQRYSCCHAWFNDFNSNQLTKVNPCVYSRPPKGDEHVTGDDSLISSTPFA
jgi:hypothetical protein